MQKMLSFGKGKCSWFTYASAVFLVNLILLILAHIIPGLVYTAPIVFVAMLVCWGSAIMFMKKEETGLGDAVGECDKWCLVVAGIVIVCTIIILIRSAVLLNEGGPAIQEGRFYLYNHEIIREITKEEYNSLLIAQGLLFLGGAMFFSTLSLVIHSGIKNLNQ